MTGLAAISKWHVFMMSFNRREFPLHRAAGGRPKSESVAVVAVVSSYFFTFSRMAAILTNPEKWTCALLKEFCISHNLKRSGKKAELLER